MIKRLLIVLGIITMPIAVCIASVLFIPVYILTGQNTFYTFDDYLDYLLNSDDRD